MSAEHRWTVEKYLDGRWHACPLPRADRPIPPCSQAFFRAWRDAMDYANRELRAEMQRKVDASPYHFVVLPDGTMLHNRTQSLTSTWETGQ